MIKLSIYVKIDKNDGRFRENDIVKRLDENLPKFFKKELNIDLIHIDDCNLKDRENYFYVTQN